MQKPSDTEMLDWLEKYYAPEQGLYGLRPATLVIDLRGHPSVRGALMAEMYRAYRSGNEKMG